MGRISYSVAQPAEQRRTAVNPAYITRASSLYFSHSRTRTRATQCTPLIPAYSSRGVTKSRGHSNRQHQSDLESTPNDPKSHTQTSHLRGEHTYDTDTRNDVTVPPADVDHIAVDAATEPTVEAVSESHEEELDNRDRPRVKVLLCGDGCDPFASADLKRFKATCLKYINGVHLDNIRVHSDIGQIGKELDWFFDPDDIALGGLLIFCFTGHGTTTGHGVALKMNRIGPKLMDTLDLHTALNKIQVPCTFEIVLGACNSEAVISGLNRLLTMEVTNAPKNAQTSPPLPSALFKSLSPVPKLTTKANIVVWAAAVDGGPAYEEADLPSRKGKNDVMIGALCRAFESAKGAIPRRTLFKKINKAVTKYNTARDKEYLDKTDAEQYHAHVTGRYRGPQLACLLSSSGNSLLQEIILDGPAFVALGGIGVADVPG